MLFDYDDSNLESIYNYAKKLEGMTFREILNEYNNSTQKFYINPNDKNVSNSPNGGTDTAVIKTTAAKGQLGNILEKFSSTSSLYEMLVMDNRSPATNEPSFFLSTHVSFNSMPTFAKSASCLLFKEYPK